METRSEPPGRHGIPGIHSEIEHDLLDLHEICLHRGKVGGKVEHQLDVFSDYATEQLLRPPQHIVQVQRLVLGLAFSAEGEQLTREAARPGRGSDDLLEVLLQGVVFRDVGQADLAMSSDDREQVVEVVGDTSHQPPQHLELLRLAQAFLDSRPTTVPWTLDP